MSERLPVINETGEVIGSEERKVIHTQGILHPEVHVLIRLSNGKFVFQKRSMTKDVEPGLLTYAVGGHVEIDETKEEAVIKELREETGIREEIGRLQYLGECLSKTGDPYGKTINYCLKYFYGYDFGGELADLQVEEKDGAGFEAFSLEEIQEMPVLERGKFALSLYNPEILGMFKKF